MLSSWVSHRNGSIFEAVVAQARMLRALGAEPVVCGLREEGSDADVWRFDGTETHLVEPIGPASFGYAPDLERTLDKADLDLLHLHGIWQYPSHAARCWAKTTARPMVISAHGMLDPWMTRRKAWKKRLARFAWEGKAWRSATAFHALTDAEAGDIANEVPLARVATIPNSAPPLSVRDTSPRLPNVLFLGYIHEHKNIAALVSAWIEARSELPSEATLTVAGWGDDRGIELLENAMEDYPGMGIEFVGTTFAGQKAALFDITRFVVLPSLSEGLPVALLEAWAAGIPSVHSAQCNLPEGFAAGAALECGTETESIKKVLVKALSLSDTHWETMSAAARELAAGAFSPKRVQERWQAAYSSLLDA